jgi:hypothetical protein
MAKRQQFSPFDVLKRTRQSEQATIETSGQPDVQTAKHPDGQTSKQLAKSKDEDFVKFTSYVRRRTHRAVKTRLVEQGREMSDLVEELLSDWLEHQGHATRPS